MVRRSKIEIDLYNPYSLDWGEEISFPSSRNVKEYGNRIYNRYPARSIFLVPRAILASIGENHLNVLDPFMGSGTTAVETVISGNNPYGLEMDPFARMVAEVSSTIFSKSELTEIKDVLTSLIDNWKTYEEAEIPMSQRSEMDRWILSSLNSLIRDVEVSSENYEPTRAGRLIQSLRSTPPSRVSLMATRPLLPLIRCVPSFWDMWWMS